LPDPRFNAAFHGDLDTIKSLTLSTWDPEKKEPPLKIAVKLQLNGDDPFWIAFTRGHYDVAKAILEIARAQYAPKEKTKRHYSVEPDDDDSDAYSDYSSETSDVEPIPIYSRIIDEQYTIENVGQVSMQVKSRTRPVELINRKEPLKSSSLLQFPRQLTCVTNLRSRHPKQRHQGPQVPP
jgi:hypothetical protein